MAASIANTRKEFAGFNPTATRFLAACSSWLLQLCVQAYMKPCPIFDGHSPDFGPSVPFMEGAAKQGRFDSPLGSRPASNQYNGNLLD